MTFVIICGLYLSMNCFICSHIWLQFPFSIIYHQNQVHFQAFFKVFPSDFEFDFSELDLL